MGQVMRESMGNPLKTILAVLFFLFAVLPPADCHAGFFSDPIPEGTEIKEPYLEGLFAPEFPYEWIKVIDTEGEDRYVVIKAKKKITGEMRRKYEWETLRKRKIIIERSGSPRTKRLLFAEMTLVRTISEMPYVVEYYTVENKKLSDKLASEAEDVIKRDDDYLIIRVTKEFGKVFKKKVELYPLKDAKCPDVPIVGRYPGARIVACPVKDGVIEFIYVVKDDSEGKDIYNFYTDKLKEHFNKIGFYYPEKFWRWASEWGMQNEFDYYYDVGKHLERIVKYKQAPTRLPDGAIFRIIIENIAMRSIIDNYSYIYIYYTIDPVAIKENIERSKVYRH